MAATKNKAVVRRTDGTLVVMNANDYRMPTVELVAPGKFLLGWRHSTVAMRPDGKPRLVRLFVADARLFEVFVDWSALEVSSKWTVTTAGGNQHAVKATDAADAVKQVQERADRFGVEAEIENVRSTSKT